MGGVGIMAVFFLIVYAAIKRARQERRVELDIADMAKLARLELKKRAN